tara:strand:- start:291 stop:533 length:243 start_codon:yes stop_codon:yes gene_type:complete
MKKELKELKELLDEGLITQEDYDNKKSDLINGVNSPSNSDNIIKTDFGVDMERRMKNGDMGLKITAIVIFLIFWFVYFTQ